MKQNDLILDLHEKPSKKIWLLLSLQHVFAMFGATVLVPILVGLPVSIALFTSGVGTLIYIICTKAKSPVYLGSSFAYITPLIAVLSYNSDNATMNYGVAVMAVGFIYVMMALIFRLFGTDWFYKILPPVVIGPVIMVIGLGLANYAMTSVGLIVPKGQNIDWLQVLISLVTTAVIIGITLYGKGNIKLIPVLIGVITGYVLAAVLGKVNFESVHTAPIFSLPAFRFFFSNGLRFNWEILLIVFPVTIVTLSEHIGDHIVLGTIIRRNLLKNPGLQKTLLGDGLATMFAGFVGGPVNTTYAENTGVISLTKIASVYVIGGAAVGAICLAFIGKVAALIQAIPTGVIGGVSIILFGMIALNGVRVLVENNIDLKAERNVIMIGVMLIIGIGSAGGINITFLGATISISGIVLAALTGIILHGILPNKELAYGANNLETNEELEELV
ncbi:MAG: uracil-xanthine permease family protein [Culicoidibacterales bacterium]